MPSVFPRLVALTAPCLLLLATSVAPIRAETWTVCPSGCDSTTLQGAINGAADGDEILLATSQPHIEADIVVFSSVTIRGLPGQLSQIRAAAGPGQGQGRVFTVLPDTRLELDEVLVAYGDSASDGGAIFNQGTTVLVDSWLQANRGRAGGGVYNEGQLICVDCQIVDNEASIGGGIFNAASGTVVGNGSRIDRNETSPTQDDGHGGNVYNAGVMQLVDFQVFDGVARRAGSQGSQASGGGIFNEGGLTLIDGRVSFNQAEEGVGGGVAAVQGAVVLSDVVLASNDAFTGGGLYLGDAASVAADRVIVSNNNAANLGGGAYVSGAFTLSNATISTNAAVQGGGLATVGTTPSLANVTVSGNSATQDGGGFFVAAEHSIRLASATVTANVADSDGDGSGDGGGIYIGSGCTSSPCFVGSAALKNSIVAANRDDSPLTDTVAPDCLGDLRSFGHNLFGQASTSSFAACEIIGDLTGVMWDVAPELEPLADQGGDPVAGAALRTHALQETSLARDAGNPSGCTTFAEELLAYDQRVAPRVDTCDVGAFEFAGVPLVREVFSDDFETGGLTAWSVAVP